MYIIESQSSKYKFLGVEEGEHTCEFCKKKHINKMFVVQDLDTGDIWRFGSQCVLNALGLTSNDIKREKTKMLKDVLVRQNNEISNLVNDMNKAKSEYIKSGKDEKLPWVYSQEFKNWERLRVELDSAHYKEKRLYQ